MSQENPSDLEHSYTPQYALAAGTFVLVMLGTTTQNLASHYSYNPALGESLFGTLYSPHKSLVWTSDLLPGSLTVLLSAWLLGFAVATATVVGLYALYIVSIKSRQKLSGHGSARWATREDVQKAGLVDTPTNKTSLIVGGFENKQSNVVEYLIHTGPESVLAYAPSRSGKGVSLVIPNLLSYEESAFVLDVKGELWNITAGYRRDGLNQSVMYHNPSSLDPGNAKLNVLDEIRVSDATAVKDTQLIAEYLIPSKKGSSGGGASANENDHFETSARSLLVGVVLHELDKALVFNTALDTAVEALNEGASVETVEALLPGDDTDKQDDEKGSETDEPQHESEEDADDTDNQENAINFPERRLITVNSILATATDPKLEFRDYLAAMQAYESVECGYAHVINQIATEMQNREDREFSSVLSSMVNPLSIYRDPILANATSRSDFKLIDLVEKDKPMSLYMIVSPSEGERLRNYFGMLVNILCRKLTEKMPQEGSKHHKLLLMLDEFSKLPPLPIVQESLDHFAGYGIKAYIVAQDVQTLTRLYGRHETIQSNCKVRIAFTPNKLETAEMLSKMVGSKTVQEKTQNRQRKALSVVDSSVSEAEGRHGRPLITVDEIMQLDVPTLDVNENMVSPGASLVFVTGCRPIKGIQTPYFMDDEMRRRSEYKCPFGSDRLGDLTDRQSTTTTQESIPVPPPTEPLPSRAAS